ncbi:hypothetical protein NC651_020797 [Populus alba x Populus x berolinensis]|nr:hypothetical protein NC651_020797 [Populus alba x Populus x berolinensis]
MRGYGPSCALLVRKPCSTSFWLSRATATITYQMHIVEYLYLSTKRKPYRTVSRKWLVRIN